MLLSKCHDVFLIPLSVLELDEVCPGVHFDLELGSFMSEEAVLIYAPMRFILCFCSLSTHTAVSCLFSARVGSFLVLVSAMFLLISHLIP